ncbi:hypothetical protein JNUCC83_04680 [Vagococcus sp. JNUCC 83]
MSDKDGLKKICNKKYIYLIEGKNEGNNVEIKTKFDSRDEANLFHEKMIKDEKFKNLEFSIRREKKKISKIIMKYLKNVTIILLFLFGIINIQEIFPFIGKVRLPQDYEVLVTPPELLKINKKNLEVSFPPSEVKKIIDNDEIKKDGDIVHTGFSMKPFIEMRVENKNHYLNSITNIEIYEYEKDYAVPLKVTKIKTDNAADLSVLNISTLGKNPYDMKSFFYLFKNIDDSFIIKYFNPRSAFVNLEIFNDEKLMDELNKLDGELIEELSGLNKDFIEEVKKTLLGEKEKKIPNIYFVVISQKINGLYSDDYIISYYHDVKNEIFEKFEKKDLNDSEILSKFNEKYGSSKETNMNILVDVKTGYDRLHEELTKK